VKTGFVDRFKRRDTTDQDRVPAGRQIDAAPRSRVLSALIWQGLANGIGRAAASTKGDGMKWVTRERPKTDRIACPWLIRKFIDAEAEFLYVPADQVLIVAEREGAYSYDAPGARYTHRDGLCSFEVLIEEFDLGDPALGLLARIVHGADVADDRDATLQSRGLLAVAEGFHLLELGDHRQLELSLPVYDALYAWCRNEVAAGRA